MRLEIKILSVCFWMTASLMIDTIRIHHRYDSLPTAGFRALKSSKSFKSIWVMNAPRRSESQPRLTLCQTDCGDWLSVEVSLPKLLFGRNTVLLSEQDIQEGLRVLSSFISETIGVEFDAMTALVGRVDYYFDFRVSEVNLNRYLAAASRATLPHTRRHIVGNSVSFGNKSKRVVLYDKHGQVINCQGPVSVEELKESEEALRLEVRHLKSRACKSLKQKHGLSFPTAQYLCSLAIARRELSAILEDLGLDKEIVNHGSRIDRLREYYGDKQRIRSLIAFITLMETYGDEFWRLGVAGYSKSLYYDHLKLVKKANALLFAETTLPPLQLPPKLSILHAA